MSDEAPNAVALTPEKGRDPKDVARLDPDRVQATVDRVIQNRMRLMDRYNGITLFREAVKAWDGKVRPGDNPSIQTLFELKKLYDEAKSLDDPKDALRARIDIIKQMTALCDRLEEQNSKIVQELRDLLAREDAKSAGGINLADLLKDAAG